LLVVKKGNARRNNGFYLLFKRSNLVILNEQAKMMGTRIKGVVQKELRYLGLYKLVNKAKKFI